jgi:HSP20 family protein
MKNPFRNLDEIQRDVGDIAVQLTHTQFFHFSLSRKWQPALNLFRCQSHFIICVELAGVDKAALDVRAEPRRVIIRGTRALPEPSCDDPPALRVLALEIDHGPFERALDLPADVDPEHVTAEHRNGLLWIKLPLRTVG